MNWILWTEIDPVFSVKTNTLFPDLHSGLQAKRQVWHLFCERSSPFTVTLSDEKKTSRLWINDLVTQTLTSGIHKLHLCHQSCGQQLQAIISPISHIGLFFVHLCQRLQTHFVPMGDSILSVLLGLWPSGGSRNDTYYAVTTGVRSPLRCVASLHMKEGKTVPTTPIGEMREWAVGFLILPGAPSLVLLWAPFPVFILLSWPCWMPEDRRPFSRLSLGRTPFSAAIITFIRVRGQGDKNATDGLTFIPCSH